MAGSHGGIGPVLARAALWCMAGTFILVISTSCARRWLLSGLLGGCMRLFLRPCVDGTHAPSHGPAITRQVSDLARATTESLNRRPLCCWLLADSVGRVLQARSTLVALGMPMCRADMASSWVVSILLLFYERSAASHDAQCDTSSCQSTHLGSS